MLEARLRDYLAANLDRIETGLSLVETEHAFPGGRIDILARWRRTLVGIELKARPYDTQAVCVQLTNYLNYCPHVWFVAPKVKAGVHSSLRHYGGRLRLYEVRPVRSGLDCVAMHPAALDDGRGNEAYDALARALPADRSAALRSLLEKKDLYRAARDALLSYGGGRYRREVLLAEKILEAVRMARR